MLTSEASARYRRDVGIIRTNLNKLVHEVNLIEENKFVDHSSKANAAHEMDPTEKLFGEAIQDSIENE